MKASIAKAFFDSDRYWGHVLKAMLSRRSEWLIDDVISCCSSCSQTLKVPAAGLKDYLCGAERLGWVKVDREGQICVNLFPEFLPQPDVARAVAEWCDRIGYREQLRTSYRMAFWMKVGWLRAFEKRTDSDPVERRITISRRAVAAMCRLDAIDPHHLFDRMPLNTGEKDPRQP